MPGIDNFASDATQNHHITVQVKTKGSNSRAWQTSTRHGRPTAEAPDDEKQDRGRVPRAVQTHSVVASDGIETAGGGRRPSAVAVRVRAFGSAAAARPVSAVQREFDVNRNRRPAADLSAADLCHGPLRPAGGRQETKRCRGSVQSIRGRVDGGERVAGRTR